MPNKIRRNSVVEMLAKVPVNRGSLLKSIESLIKTIECSESSIMIPTLLRDKCDFDAWELMFVAKILKASILGHTDLVEFYMNHMRQLISQQQQQQLRQAQSSNNTSALQSPTTPKGSRQLTSPMSSPNLLRSPIDSNAKGTLSSPQSCDSSTLSSTSSAASNGSNNVATATGSVQTGSLSNSNSSSNSNSQAWLTASSCLASTVSLSSTSSMLSSSTTMDGSSSGFVSSTATCSSLASSSQPAVPASQPQQAKTEDSSAVLELRTQLDGLRCPNTGHLLAAGKPPSTSGTPQQRSAQPPSLLQLTTTNNHINSLGGTPKGSTESAEGSAPQLVSRSPVQLAPADPLSISTTSGSGGLAARPVGSISAATTPVGAAAACELKTSRSAGCLFRRTHSCASSPRSQAGHSIPNQPNGVEQNPALTDDPTAPVKLLLQIEQLKSSILSVTLQLESVVELYKKSIDNIA